MNKTLCEELRETANSIKARNVSAIYDSLVSKLRSRAAEGNKSFTYDEDEVDDITIQVHEKLRGEGLKVEAMFQGPCGDYATFKVSWWE